MTIASWCVLIACLLPYVFTGLAKFTGRRYNNYRPRDFLEQLDGWRKRAHWVQLNSFEALPPFIAAVLIAQQQGGPQDCIDQLAVGFIVLRGLYGVFYLSDKAILRTLSWTLSVACVVAIFISAA